VAQTTPAALVTIALSANSAQTTALGIAAAVAALKGMHCHGAQEGGPNAQLSDNLPGWLLQVRRVRKSRATEGFTIATWRSPWATLYSLTAMDSELMLSTISRFGYADELLCHHRC
jgi:hypothetical protein